MKDHIIPNICSKFVKHINKLDNFPVQKAIWSMFMNDCTWAVLNLGEECEKFTSILVNHQIQKIQTIMETLQARRQDITNDAAELYGISLWQDWQTESWKNGLCWSHKQDVY